MAMKALSIASNNWECHLYKRTASATITARPLKPEVNTSKL